METWSALAARLVAAGVPDGLVYDPAARCPQGHKNATPEGAYTHGAGEPCVDCALAQAVREERFPASGDIEAKSRWGLRTAARAERLLAHPDPSWRLGRGGPRDFARPAVLWDAWDAWCRVTGQRPTVRLELCRLGTRAVVARCAAEAPSVTVAVAVAWTAFLGDRRG